MNSLVEADLTTTSVVGLGGTWPETVRTVVLFWLGTLRFHPWLSSTGLVWKSLLQ